MNTNRVCLCASECVHKKKIKNSVGLIWVRRRHCIIIIIHICMCFELLTLILNRARVWECECVSKHTAIKGTLRKLWAHSINKYQSFLDMNNVWFFLYHNKKRIIPHARTHALDGQKKKSIFLFYFLRIHTNGFSPLSLCMCEYVFFPHFLLFLFKCHFPCFAIGFGASACVCIQQALG